MKIKIVGAAGGEVTGSAYYVQTKDAKGLIDAGLFQGGKKSEAKNRLPSGVNLSKLDAVLLTHAHLDHTGRVPLLIKHGYAGRIYGTAATIELAELILEDSARLQAHEAERANRKRDFSPQGPVEPLYSPEDILHHLRHGLPRDNTHVLIVGYQTQGSLGRRLVAGAKSVSMFGEKISVRAKVNTLGGFSAHAGQSDLLQWLTPLAASRPQIIITHGEDAPRKKLSAAIEERFGLRSQLPSQGNIVEISAPVLPSQALAS